MCVCEGGSTGEDISMEEFLVGKGNLSRRGSRFSRHYL